MLYRTAKMKDMWLNSLGKVRDKGGIKKAVRKALKRT